MKIGNKSIFIILLLGLLVRIIFYFFGGEIYFGKTDFQVGGDSAWWFINIKNLVDYGIYTDNINNPLGYFTRTPGYSFFLGIFYLLLSKDQILTFKYAVIAQIILDVLSILFMYLISLSIFNNYKNALITALIYALYPFIIVWNVVAYAESLSVFLFLAAIYTFIGFKKERYFALSGFLFGLAILTRIQIIVFIPIILLVCLYRLYYKQLYSRQVFFFILFLTITYGTWPIRNYVNHGKLIFSQHLGDRGHWSPDIMYFRDYIWSVKTDWDPQITQILKGEYVEFPSASYIHAEDSIFLIKVVELARNCGEGFSYFARAAGLRDTVIKRGEDCNDEIVDIFKMLIANQKKYNKINYYIKVPLKNMKKAIFKYNLYNPATNKIATFANILFTYRTFLILIGLLSLIYILISDKKMFFSSGILIIVGYVTVWYIFNSFVYRNMEIRYLIHADILLLLPASFGINKFYSAFKVAFLSK